MKLLEMIYFHRVLLGVCGLIVLMMFAYYNLLTYHVQRIFSQRMYMYGFTHNLHGNILSPPGTFKFEKVAHEPDNLPDKAPIYLLILISSSPHKGKHTDLREAIRRTWGFCGGLSVHKGEYKDAIKSQKNISCKVFFYMGRSRAVGRDASSIAELEKYQDLVIGDFLDSYHNMTRKMMFGLNWAFQKFNPQFVLKADDDVYINVPQLINLVNTKYAHIENLYGGHVYYASVIRDETHRHYLTRDEYPNDWYPPYNKGAQLIISGHLLGKLLTMSTRMKRFQIDDAYLGILMNHISVLPVKVKEFIQNQWLTYFVRWISTCDLKAMVGIGDNFTPSQMNYIHSVVHHKASWYCVRLDYLAYYLLFLFVFILFILLFMRQRYCPWLTIPILAHSFNIFVKRICK